MVSAKPMRRIQNKVQPKKQKEVEVEQDYYQVRARFHELKAIFKEVGSQNIEDKSREEMALFKGVMDYKSRKQEMKPAQAAQVLKKAMKIVVFTGDVMNCESSNQMRFQTKAESTTQLFMFKTFLQQPETIWKWVKDYKEACEQMKGETGISDEIVDFLSHIEEKNQTSASKIETSLVTTCIDGIQKKKIEEAGLNTKVYEIEGSIDRAHCYARH